MAKISLLRHSRRISRIYGCGATERIIQKDMNNSSIRQATSSKVSAGLQETEPRTLESA